MVLVLERRSRDPCGQFPVAHALKRFENRVRL
jgi:hypothetical protein